MSAHAPAAEPHPEPAGAHPTPAAAPPAAAPAHPEPAGHAAEADHGPGKVAGLVDATRQSIVKGTVGTAQIPGKVINAYVNELREAWGKSPTESLNPLYALASIAGWTRDRVKDILSLGGKVVDLGVKTGGGIAKTVAIPVTGTLSAADKGLKHVSKTIGNIFRPFKDWWNSLGSGGDEATTHH